MKKLFLFLGFLHISSSVKHTLKVAFVTTTGIPNLPQFTFTVLIDDIRVRYCDSNRKIDIIGDVTKKVLDENPEIETLNHAQCFEVMPNFLKHRLYGVMHRFNQTEGLHCLQVMQGYEWDQNTGEISSYSYYSYDGEDLVSLDLKTLKWIPLKPEAVVIKHSWDKDKSLMKRAETFITEIYPECLKLYLNYERRSQMRTDLPSVSLLQKSPSSPISCFATGFYPNRADMFWRRDGEQIHEDVDHGEILPNPDGTFQVRVDLDLSSVTAEDWSSYDCVFHLSGVKDDVITKLDRAGIRTNEDKPGSPTTVLIIVVVVVVLVVIIVSGVMFYKRKAADADTNTDTGSELMEGLTPET